jgi:hypothetical protein
VNPRIAPLIEAVRTHRDRFDSFALELSEEELQRPVPGSDWIVKDFISHIESIDLTVREWFRSFVDGTPPAPAQTGEKPEESPGFDIDAWNNRQVLRRRDQPVEKIVEEGRILRDELLGIMARFSDEVIDGDIPFPGDVNRKPEPVNFGAYLVAWATHEPAHAMDMLRALPERKDDPALRRWLDAVEFSGWPPTKGL